MGVIAFGRPPQEALEQIKQALGMVELIHQIATNPDMGDTIEDLSLKLAAAQTMSVEKQKQAMEAEEIMARAQEHLEDFASEKKSHQAKIEVENKQIQSTKEALVAEQKRFDEMKKMQDTATKIARDEAAEKLAQAQKYSQQGAERTEAAIKLERELHLKLESSQKELSDWNINKAQQEAELNDKWNAHAAAMTKLAEDRKTVETMKKKLEAALNA